VSFERSMKCAIRLCGHCQLGPEFVCHDGPVFTWDRVGPLLRVREL
jgi:NAD(P)H-flavin reductase